MMHRTNFKDQVNKSERHLICTIIAPNYFSQALTLGESLAKHMPHAVFRILVLQDCTSTDFIQRGIEKYQAVTGTTGHLAQSISDIEWFDFDIWSAANYYQLLEFATSVKPALLRSYLDQGWGRVTYLDPDTQVHKDFDPLLNDDFALSLIPHILKDFPIDGDKPDQESILTSGIFNLGFISVRPGASDLIDWWSGKLQTYCTVDPTKGLFVDQRWMDWSMAFADPQIIRNPGVNVAYWNLHERQVKEVDAGYEVKVDEESHPLYFFHFSGFSSTSPSRLSKYSNRSTSAETLSRRLLKNYGAERSAWEKFIDVPSWSIAGRKEGVPLPDKYRHAALNHARLAQLTQPDPLQEIVEIRSALPTAPVHLGRCASCANCAQPFLRRAVENFANFLQSDRHEAETDLSESGYSSEVLAYFSRSVGVTSNPKAGLKLLGCFASPTGVGQCSRNLLKTLDAAGVPVFAELISTPLDTSDLLANFGSRQQPSIDYLPSVIAVVNAESWLFEVIYSNRVNLKNQSVAAVWAWEIEQTPEYFDRPLMQTDAVFALSPFSANSLARGLNHPIAYLPTFGEFTPRDVAKPPTSEYQEFALSHGIKSPYLLARFDSKSILRRKNPDAVIDVWEKIHEDYPEVQLVVKTINFHEFASHSLLKRLRGLPRVVVIDEVMSQNLNQELMNRAVAYISLHRAEGLGLNILEAISADIPTIYTNYSGIASELDGTGFPVNYSLAEVGHDAGPYQSDAIWAEPDAIDAVLQTRRALDLALSGEWDSKREERAEWLSHFYSAAHDRTVELALDLLNMPLKASPVEESSKIVYLELRVKRILVLFARRVWKLIPVTLRIKFRPYAMQAYRRFF